MSMSSERGYILDSSPIQPPQNHNRFTRTQEHLLVDLFEMRDRVWMLQVFEIRDDLCVHAFHGESRPYNIVFQEFSWLVVLEYMHFVAV